MLATRSMLTARSTLATHSMRSLATIRRLGTDDPRMSQIVVHNGIVHTCGQTDAEGKTVEEQTRTCLAKVDALLARAGTDKSQLLTASIWLKHIEQDFAAMNGVWNAWLDPANKPVRFCVEVRGHSQPLLATPDSHPPNAHGRRIWPDRTYWWRCRLRLQLPKISRTTLGDHSKRYTAGSSTSRRSELNCVKFDRRLEASLNSISLRPG